VRPIDLLPAIAFAAPLVLAAVLLVRRLRPVVAWLAPLAAAPALALALGLAPGARFEVDWLLLGTRAGGDDPLDRGFLLATALLWGVGAAFARRYLADDRRRDAFYAYFLIAMSGNLGVVLADDVASFYLAYGMMSLASYGLVVHAGSAAARRAGRVYLTLALLGDVVILAALAAIVPAASSPSLAEAAAAVAASPRRELVVALLFVGFGVKAGAALPLHVWLPLAHPVAPTPASAVLSGAMIKAGLLGWLRFLPLGIVAMPDAGLAFAAIGIFAAFYAALVGLTQRDAKTVLAYSSISQMGLMMVLVGAALAWPAAAPLALTALIGFVVHHALAKGALFLGIAVAAATTAGGWARWLVALALVWPALEIAGAPLSSGALVKGALKDTIVQAPTVAGLGTLVALAAVGSALLMARFLALALPRREAPGRPPPAGLWLPWAALLVVDGALFAVQLRDGAWPGLFGGTALVAGLWPLAAAAALIAAARLSRRRDRRLSPPAIPPGDVLAPLGWALGHLGRALAAIGRRVDRGLGAAIHHGEATARRTAAALLDRLDALDRPLGGFGVVGVSVALLIAGLVALLLA
jgi:formate hydrogenlyase subunit 3/multisubunit Na+/H+ antiporter MnhD subunit